MNSALILVFCSASVLAQNAPVAPYSPDYYGVPWKTGNLDFNIMKRALVQWHGADEYEKVDNYMTEVAMVYQSILYNYLDTPFEMRNTTVYVTFKGEKTKNNMTLYKYNVDMYSLNDGTHWRQRRIVLDNSFFVVRYFKRPGQNNWESTTGGNNWETTTGGDNWETTTGGDYWETTTGGDNWETTDDYGGQYMRMETTGGDNWETSTGGDYWETTTGGDNWETTTGGDNWETTTGGDNWETSTGGDNWETSTGGDSWETSTGGDNWETTDDYNWETSSGSSDNWETATDSYNYWYDNWDWETTDGPLMG